MEHSDWALKFIDDGLRGMGVQEYRFCKENDCYVCDKEGNVYSVCHRQYSKSGRLIKKYRIRKLAGSLDRYGYLTYRMTIDGLKKHIKAHRLILNTWTESHEDMCVNHMDGNKLNNSLSNLEWCTVAENNAHAIRTGLFNPYARMNFSYVVPISDWMSIYLLNKHCGYSYSRLGRMNGCTHDTIKAIVNRIDGVMTEVTHG